MCTEGAYRHSMYKDLATLTIVYSRHTGRISIYEAIIVDKRDTGRGPGYDSRKSAAVPHVLDGSTRVRLAKITSANEPLMANKCCGSPALCMRGVTSTSALINDRAYSSCVGFTSSA
jgi:hypothetical protein